MIRLALGVATTCFVENCFNELMLVLILCTCHLTACMSCAISKLLPNTEQNVQVDVIQVLGDVYFFFFFFQQ